MKTSKTKVQEVTGMNLETLKHVEISLVTSLHKVSDMFKATYSFSLLFIEHLENRCLNVKYDSILTYTHARSFVKNKGY